MIYFLVFFSSVFFYWRGVKNKNQYIRHVMLAAAVLILALMAGLRDYTVGTDVGVYGLYAFEKARQYGSLWKLITNYTMSIEPGYAVIAYLSSRISSDPHVFFFLIGAIIYSLVAKAVYDFRNQINATMAWFLYLFLFWGDTLNIMRQSVALAIVFYGMRYIRTLDIRKVIAVLVVASLFHSSAIIALGVYIIYLFAQRKPTARVERLWGWAVGAGVVTVVAPTLFGVLIRVGILPEVYTRYLGAGSIGIVINPTLIRLLPIILILVFWKGFRKNKDAEFMMIMLILDMIIYNLTTVSSTFERICLYFGFYRIYAYSMLLLPATSKTRDNRLILGALLCGYAVVIFVYQIILMGGNQIYPYTSGLLGI